MSQTIAPSGRQTQLILIGTALLLALGMGMRQSFGLFLTPVTHDLAVTAADFTLALAVQNVVWGLSQALVGAIADRFGLRITMMAGAAIYIVGMGIMAAAHGALALIISGGLIGVALSCTATSLAMTACVRARGAWPGHAEPTVSRDVGGLFRLRPQSRIPEYAFASLSGDLRPGPDVGCRSACRDRGRERHRLIAYRLARRDLSEAHPLRAPLHPTFGRWPGLVPLIGGLVAEIFGTRYLATLLGLSFVVHQAGSSIGAWGGGLILDLYGSYDRAWQIGTLIGFAAGIVQILAGGPTRRQDRMIARGRDDVIQSARGG